RRSKSLEVLIPILYLKGVSTGAFEEALAALLGKDAGGLSASTIVRLKEAWLDEHARWLDRDLSAKPYVYFWVDGIYVQARLEDASATVLGAQNGECPEQAAKQPARKGQASVATHLDGGDQDRRRGGIRRIHRSLRRQIREGCRVPKQGS